jgi:predicted nucleic acid-binding protein
VIVVDSSVWIDYFTGQMTPATDRLESVLGVERVAIGDLMLAEVLQGFRIEGEFRQAKKLLLSLTVLSILNIDIALKSATNYRKLRKKGITVRQTVDTIIATYCLEHDLPLLHSDRDFQPFHDHLSLQNALVA